MENRFDKCKYCKNYEHAQRNANLPYKCQLDKWDCFDIYEMPRYDEVNDKAYRDQELEEFRKLQEEQSKKSNRKEEIMNILEGIKHPMMYEIYMKGVNMTDEYQGCWVRFRDIEKVVNKYFDEVLEDGKDKTIC